MRLLSSALVLSLALGACVNEQVVPPKTESCTNGVDDDGNGKIDCFDPVCFQKPACQQVVEDCGNGVDDDRNNLTDCADPACSSSPLCLDFELCDNGLDDNADGKIDCADPDCGARNCGTGRECRNLVRAEAACNDALDNDQDGNPDCADADCAAQACGTGCVCRSLGKAETACTDGLDNDGDTKTDCFDGPDCDGTSCGSGCVCTAGAKHETNCTNGTDDDVDGLRDCADTTDCSGAANLCGTGAPETGALCNDGLDNDLDGSRDCADADCDAQACGVGCACRSGAKAEVTCNDTADNDGDSFVDCIDPDCIGGAPEANCSDDRDDNCNGRVDCADSSCAASCSGLAMGKACSTNSQCASGTCRTESASGWPSGACVGASSGCTLDGGVSYGCPAGAVCEGDLFGRFCRQSCTSGGCRPGYACHENEDPDYDGKRSCFPLCATDADCSRDLGAAYGCNSWSRRCELKNKGQPKYGAACSGNSGCESGVCISDRGGYCGGYCVRGGACAADGACGSDGLNDQTGRCFDVCLNASECTRGAPYQCAAAPYGGTSSLVCYCRRAGEPCTANSDCCNPGIGFPACLPFGICGF